MSVITDFTGWTPEQIIAYCRQVSGARERTPEEWEEYYREEERKEEAHQEYLKELYDTGEYLVYKRACPVCGKVFYTCNERRVYDDYYKCSRYKHRENAKLRRYFERGSTTCGECGRVFVPARAGAKYCCAACKQKAYRKRAKPGAQNGHTD